VRAAQDRRLVTGGGSLTALRAARAMGTSTVLTRQGETVVCVAWRDLELLPPRNGPAGRALIRVSGVRVWNDTLEWLLLTTRPVETLDHAKAQRKAKIQPDRVADQLRREAAAGVEGLGRARHGRLIANS